MKQPSLLLALLLTAGAALAEPAVTIRATPLQAQAESDAATVDSLAENTRVELVARKGAWAQVRTAGGQGGWVRMLALRPEAAGGAQAAPAGGGAATALKGLLTAGRSSNSATVTTGVRGLSEEDLQNAQANPAELQKLQQFTAQRQTAQAFAQRARLAAQQVEYLPQAAAGSQRNGEN